MKPRIFLTASVLCTVIFLLFSCTDTETAPEEAADTGILTNRQTAGNGVRVRTMRPCPLPISSMQECPAKSHWI